MASSGCCSGHRGSLVKAAAVGSVTARVEMPPWSASARIVRQSMAEALTGSPIVASAVVMSRSTMSSETFRAKSPVRMIVFVVSVASVLAQSNISRAVKVGLSPPIVPDAIRTVAVLATKDIPSEEPMPRLVLDWGVVGDVGTATSMATSAPSTGLALAVAVGWFRAGATGRPFGR